MNMVIKENKYQLTPETEHAIKEKIGSALRLLGDKKDSALVEIEVEQAPPEGRSSEPYRLVARVAVEGKVYRAEAVKPTPEIAADRVRDDIEAEIRSDRGRARRLWRRGSSAIKGMLRLD